MLNYIKREWFTILFFAVAIAYFLYGLAPDVTWMSIGADMSSYVVASKYGSPGGLGGYPLYLLLGSLFTKLPFNPYVSMGLLSVLPTVGTGIVIYKIVKESTTSRFAPYFSSLVFYSAFIVWAESVIVETYSLSTFVMSLVIYFCLKKNYKVMGIMQALCLGLHPLTIFAILPCTVYAWWDRGKDWKVFWQVVGITSLGLLFQLRSLFVSYKTANIVFQDNPIEVLINSAGGYFSLPVIPFKPTLDRIEDELPIFLNLLWVLPFVILGSWRPSKNTWLLLSCLILSFFFTFSSLYPQWIKYLVVTILPLSILAGRGFARVDKDKLAYLAVIPGILLASMNMQYYSPGKTIDPSPTTARQYYQLLDTLPDKSIVVYSNWGHPELVNYEYCVDNRDRIDFVDWSTIVSGSVDRSDYKQSLISRGINLPEGILGKEASMPLDSFSKELQLLNPERSIYVCYIKESSSPMQFSLVPSSEYRVSLNDIPESCLNFIGGVRVQ